jgi:hypothetical protein
MSAPIVGQWSRKGGSLLLHRVRRLAFGRYVETACGLTYQPEPIDIGMLCPHCVGASEAVGVCLEPRCDGSQIVGGDRE